MITTRAELQPSRALRGRARYERKSSLRPIDLRLDANEGGAFAAEVLRELSLEPDVLRRYPDARELESIFASRLGIGPQRVVVTAGADDALERVCRAVLEPGRRAAYAAPTFEMIPRYVRSCGAEADEVPWIGGAFPTDALIAAAAGAAAVFVVSPNNPTGGVATTDDLRRIREALPEALLVVDAAYGEFADEDLTPLALTMPRTVATRTMSKAWSIAGLRVGYAAGDERVIGWLRAIGQPYAVSNTSLYFAKGLLERGEERMRAFVARVRDERGRLAPVLAGLGAEPLDGQANFVLARFRDAALVADLLEGVGIAVRRFSPDSGLADLLRIGCPGEPAAFGRLKRGLQLALRPQTIIVEGSAEACAVRFQALQSVRSRYRLCFSTGSPLLESSEGAGATWAVVESPEDVCAARAAGMIAIGCVTPGSSRDAVESALLRAGAARVIDNVDQLLEMLP